jgi:hypothetical protein
MREVRGAAADILDRITLVDASRKKNVLQEASGRTALISYI